MNQFKDPLLGKIDLGYSRATSAQRCVRAGGKHNDLENVGYTARHHTFFEMMGNFSFGDYFKEETITWAWEFATDVVGLSEKKILITVHPTDHESRKIWRDKVGIKEDRIIDLEENFWTMGDTGPCGPCTELFYDHGPLIAGGPPGSPDEDGDRFIEFQNLVFPQFDRLADGEMISLPQAGVDTGMGLERMAAILQGVHSNYEIDLFRKVMLEVGAYAGISNEAEVLGTASLRVIADHIRSSAFLIADGITPGSEDRAYVLRRIIRRALRHGYKLNIREPFFHKLVKVLVDEMGSAYPLLGEHEALVTAALADEEARFSETLNQGMDLLKAELDQVVGDTLPGETAFKLYDTYGFPVDLTADVARELGLRVDQKGFDDAMEQQRARGRASTSFSTTLGQKITVNQSVIFLGYEVLESVANVIAVFDINGDAKQALSAGEEGVVVLDKTPFYAESGGQVGDSGELLFGDGCFHVSDTQISGDQRLHIGVMCSDASSSIGIGNSVTARVNQVLRKKIQANHSATHLMHAALRSVLGDHVNQKGSLVNDEKLRFDFSHTGVITATQLDEIESQVNKQIMLNTPVYTEVMEFDDAVARGAMALFGEKYGDEVRVLSMGGDYSLELCGGTHVERTGAIGLFKIKLENGIAAGTRRIEAVSGEEALESVRQNEKLISSISSVLKVGASEIDTRIAQVITENKALHRQVEQLGLQIASNKSSDLSDQVSRIGNVDFLAVEIDGDSKAMMQTLDTLRSKLSVSSIIVLAQVSEGKVGMVVSVSKALTERVQAPELLSAIAEKVGAKGGGRADLARAGGGSNPEGIAGALTDAKSWLLSRLES
jgi:alanyl-tRNA synthetase